MSNRAVFIDRDGTLVEARHYPSRPEDLVLYGGICDELRVLQSHGFKLVLVTNQSGIARGYFSEHDLARMHESLCSELARKGVTLDAIYYCPHHSDGVVDGLSIACDCRKPAPGMLLRAAQDLDLDLSRSWFVGDILDDVEAGNRAGCRTVLVDLGTEAAPVNAMRRPDFVGCDAVHAMHIVQAAEHIGNAGEIRLDYLPVGWLHMSSTDPSASVTGGVHADDD